MLKRKFPCFPFKRRDCMETICHKSGNIRNYQLAGTGRLAQRIVLDAAVATATLVAGIAATTASSTFAPLFPNNLRIHHATGSHLTTTVTFHFGKKANAYPVNQRSTHLRSRRYSSFSGSSRVIESAHTVYFHCTSLSHITT